MKIQVIFLLDIDEFMDSSVLDFVSGIVPPEAIRHDHEPENQRVLTQVIEPNRKTLSKQSLLPLKRKLVYILKRSMGVSAFRALNKDVYVVNPTALPPPKWRLVEVEYLM